MQKERNVSIDILKMIGILFVILAHVSPPGIVTQIRSFDVPLLVIISAMLGVKSIEKIRNYTFKNLLKYYSKRVLRLVAPVWIFLTIFFIAVAILKFFQIEIEVLSVKNVLSSYLCLQGIGYVWIIRVYVLCTFMLPFIVKFKKINNTRLLITIFILYVLYELSVNFLGTDNPIMNYIIYYLIPYGIVCTYIGTNLEKANNKKLKFYILISLSIFLLLAVILFITEGHFVLTNVYKYPPQLYYLSFAIGISILLYYFIDRKNIFNVKEKLNKSYIVFISKHSMWIYLWHIPFVYITNLLMTNYNWIIRYIIVLSGGILLTYIQNLIVRKLKIKNKTILSILN